MGLDMYLTGEKYFYQNWEDPSQDPTEDGFRVESHRLALGYWRKHPDLHGYIVQTFAGGVDDCQDIELNVADMSTIITAIRAKSLPHTEGFFFGTSYDSEEQRAEDINIFLSAIAWLESGGLKEEPVVVAEAAGMVMLEVKPSKARESRSVIYRASW